MNGTLVDNEIKENSIKYEYSIEDARDTLDRIIGFIGNCDTKASVMLGVLGVILTIIITDSSLSKFYLTIKTAITSKTALSVIYLILLIIAAVVFLIGILLIVSVLMAKNCSSQKDSKIYFTDIALNKNYNVYKEKVLNQLEREVLEDFIAQIHINSIICNKKYKRYNLGLVLALLGFGSLIILLITGILVCQIGG